MKNQKIILKNVCVHNLKSVTLELDTQELIVFTGVSGSGKSSLAFDTLYAEGQRRYVESLSTFARRQLGELSKPDMESASGISPTISIEQKTAGRNPRSTVGTITEIYDYLRVLYARVGTAHCPVSGDPVTPQSRERIIKMIQNLPKETKIIILSPFAKSKKAEFKEDFLELLRKGFMRVRVDNKILSLEEEISLDGNVAHDVDIVIDRITVGPENDSRIAESVTQALQMGQGLCSVLNVENQTEELFSMHAYSPKSGLSYGPVEPPDFSFNSPSGMCPRCHGLGEINEFDLEKIIDPNLSISEDCCLIATSYQTVRYGNIYDNLARLFHFHVDTPWKKLDDKAKRIFLYGTEDNRWLKMHFVHPTEGYVWTDRIQWRGVLHEAHMRYAEAKSDAYRKKMAKWMREQKCPECQGQRLKPYPAAVRLNEKKISEVTGLTIEEAFTFFDTLILNQSEKLIAEDLLKEIKQRLKFLLDVGLHYLTLDRTAPTLSGGEAQRVRLASQIGSGLVGITYILDEPSIGLHPRDNKKLIQTLKHLRNMGNTVVVVEHDEETIWEADRIVDVGPGPGSRGGEIVVNGDIFDLLKCKNSTTAAYLSGKLQIPFSKKRKKPSDKVIEIKGARHHNLKNVDVKIPLGLFTCITGVSGSGKSSLVTDTLYPALANHLHQASHFVGAHDSIEGFSLIDKVIAIDQSPIGRNPRSNPSTYIKLFDDIRDLFSQLPESRAHGFKPGRFSFNVSEGSCTQCNGMGMIKIDMDFMEAAWVECPLCLGKRFDQETLNVHYKGKNIYDILEMEIIEAIDFFAHIPSIVKKLTTLKQVGLEYIKLGQSSTTLSGGEAQRVKLAKELVRPSTGFTFYILDEPTTGLHFHDIKQLLDVLHELVNRGNTVLVIEHNMDVVKTADWIIDLGPEGGGKGGKITATGTPESIAKLKSPTGHAVQEALHHNSSEKIEHALKKKKERELEKKKRRKEAIREIVVEGAEQNNLKQISARVPRDKMTVCTGPSGSGKSSFAFDTVYAEGQRRYIESLSAYARQFVQQMPKPKVAHVEGLSPAIAIEQKAHAGNPRSTVGTMTEIYDYLRILFARLGIPHSPDTGEEIKAISKETVALRVLTFPEGERIQILAPLEWRKNEKFQDLILRYSRQGYLRMRLNGKYHELEENIEIDRKRKNEILLVIDRLIINATMKNRLLESISNAASIGNKHIVIDRTGKDLWFNLAFAEESTGKSYAEITPHTFSFNTPEGMCPECEGLGYQYGANFVHQVELMQYSTSQLMDILWQDFPHKKADQILLSFLKTKKIEPKTPLFKLKSDQLDFIMNGDEAPIDLFGIRLRWRGINHVLSKLARSSNSEIKKIAITLLETTECMMCQGTRINALARHVTINQLAIHQLCALPIDQALGFIEALSLNKENSKILEEVQKQLISRLHFLCDVGLHYLSLNRGAPTLSGGEAQRIRLAKQLGSGLTGVLYVLDEPTIGLHPRDNELLNQALAKLKDLGNTLLMVEHDPLTIAKADYILDFGPHSGTHGGHITARGTYEEIKRNPQSLTGSYLSGKLNIPTPPKRKAAKNGKLVIKNAHLNNLKNIQIEIPIGLITCLTGVSGSGKSTLMNDLVLPSVEKGLRQGKDTFTTLHGTVKGINSFDKLLSIDQNPVGHTVRSDVGTYVDVLSRMREFFASLPSARTKGLMPKHFSYNHKHGMCSGCMGLGYKRVEMVFLPPVKVTCTECQGLRLNPISLQVTYSGKSFGQYLDYTIDETRIAFQNFPRMVRILDTLISVGLGYLKLGQEVVTLSGGEAQRIKLSRELAKRATGRTLYLLDEPTTGLHYDDIAKLLKVLHKLVDKGNTLVIIEHNLDIIKNADYVIDLGPEAGEKGGEVICTGTPEEIIHCKHSYTGQFLKRAFDFFNIAVQN